MWKNICAGVLGCIVAMSVACMSPTDVPATISIVETPDDIGLAELTRLDLAARFKRSVTVGSFSSYDRTGGNDDGFSGAHSFIRRDDEGLVLAELEGPGAIYRIWTPTPTDDILAFYFDGEVEPRLEIPFRELFSGERAPFLSPVVGYGAGGFYCYLPIAFERSLRVVARAERIQFYQMNYAIYPATTAVASFDGYGSPETEALLARARELLGSAGGDLSASVAPPGARVRTTAVRATLTPGNPGNPDSVVTLFDTATPGRLLGLRLEPVSLLASKARDVVLRIYWDDDPEPAVLSPVGDFFGASWGDPAMQSAIAGTYGDTAYIHLPMPFDRSARIELVSERTGGAPIEVRGEVAWTDVPRAEDEGRFYALWRRENPTTVGEPFTFIDTSGRGHIVGATLQAQGFEPAQTPFFEGDDQATLDGELAIHGTGSEDFFNGGWYNVTGRWMGRVSLPLSGCLDYRNPLGRTGGYRFMLTDAYAFRRSARLTIEHAPTGNDVPTDYVGVTYLYAEARPTMAFELPPVADRRVSDPERIVFRPGWSLPVDSFSFRDMSLTKRQESIGDETVRYLRVRAEGEDVFGAHSVGFRCDLPEAGAYTVSAGAIGGPDQAIVQIVRNEGVEGDAVDLYQAERGLRDPIRLAELDFVEGENVLLLRLVGKNERSSGLGLDLTSLVFERVR